MTMENTINVAEENVVIEEGFVPGKVTIIKETAKALEKNLWTEYDSPVEYHDKANEILLECISRLANDEESFEEIKSLYTELRTMW